MKKSNFMAMVLGTISGLLFALGMCMALLPAWNLFTPGIIVGASGALLAMITVLIWRKMEHKQMIHITGRTILAGVIAVAGVLVLGFGMSLAMVWGSMPVGIVIGVVGILLLFSLVPVTKGLK